MTTSTTTPENAAHPAWVTEVQRVEGATFLRGKGSTTEAIDGEVVVRLEQFVDGDYSDDAHVALDNGRDVVMLTPDQALNLAAALAVHAIRAERAL